MRHKQGRRKRAAKERRNSGLKYKIKDVGLPDAVFVDFATVDFESLCARVLSGSAHDSSRAFDQIERALRGRIYKILWNQTARGFELTDLYQEALYALRFIVIPTYDKNLGTFPSFVGLCVKRHLCTVGKSCFSNKSRVLNFATSLEYDSTPPDAQGLPSLAHAEGARRGESDGLSYHELITDPKQRTSDEAAEEEDWNRALLSELWLRLSPLEIAVLEYRQSGMTYQECACSAKQDGFPVLRGVKTIDNALMRVKQKASRLLRERESLEELRLEMRNTEE